MARKRVAAVVALALSIASGTAGQDGASDAPDPAAEIRAEKQAQRNQFIGESQQLRQQGKLAEALKMAQQVAALEEELLGPDDQNRIPTWEFAGMCAEEAEDWPAAEATRDQAWRIAKLAYGEDNWRTSDARRARLRVTRWQQFSAEVRVSLRQTDDNNLRVGELSSQGKYADAIALAEQNLQTREKLLGPDDLDTATSQGNLAYLFRLQGKLAEAEPLFQRSLKTAEDKLGPDHPVTATRLNNLAVFYENQAKYAAAEPLLQRALKIREKSLGPDDPDVAISLNDLAELYSAQGNHAAAEPLNLRAIAIAEKVYGPEHKETGTYLNNLAVHYQARGKFAEAEPLYRRALKISETFYGPEYLETASSLNSLATICEALGKEEEAERLYLRALEIWEKSLGPEHPKTAESLSNLALFYKSQRKLEAVEAMYQRALKIREKTLGPEHPDIAISLGSLAGLYQEQGNYAAAEPLFRRALQICTKAQGAEHPNTAVSLYNLSSLFKVQGKYSDAESLQLKALKIREKALGPDHPDTASSLNDLGLLYQAQGKSAQAEALFKQALGVYEKALGPDHVYVSTTLNNLALLNEEQGNYGAAEPLFLRALKISETVRGNAHPDVAVKLNNLAGLYVVQGDYVRAEPLYRRALEVREFSLGPGHPLTGGSVGNLAEFYRKLGNYSAAEPLCRRALAIHRQAFGPDHPDTGVSLNNLALLLQAKGDFSGADSLFQQALAIKEKTLGPDHPTTATALNNLALLYKDEGNYAEAEPLLQRALAIREKALGPDHPDTANSLNALAILYKTVGNYAAAEPLFLRAQTIYEKALGADHSDTAHNLDGLALLYWSTGDRAAARSRAGRGLDVQLGHLARTAAVQTEQQQLLMTAAASNHLNTWLTVTSEDPGAAREAWQRVLVWKGLTTTRQVGLRQALKDDPTYAEFRLASQQLSTVALSPPLPPADPKSQADWNQRAPELRRIWQEKKTLLEAECERLEKELAGKSAAFHQQHQRQAVTPEAIAGSLRQSSQPTALVDLIEYWYSGKENDEKSSEQRVAAFVVRSDGKIHRIELGPSAPLHEALNDWRSLYGRVTSKQDPGRELKRLLWTPLESCLTDIDTLLVSPDGALAQLPWGALPGTRHGTYLIEDISIAVIPVPQMLPELLGEKAADGPPSSLLLVGDIDYRSDSGAATELIAQTTAQGRLRDGSLRGFSQLPAANAELTAIDQQFRRQSPSGSAKILNGQLATEAAFREQAPRYPWLHVITHGFFAPAELTGSLQSELARGLDPAKLAVPTIEVGAPPGRIGLDVAIRDGRCIAKGLVPQGAAAQDGRVQVGDEVVEVLASSGDWIPTAGKTVEQIASHIRGPAGTAAHLKVRTKANPDRELEYAIVRAAVPGLSAPRAVLNPGLLSGLALAGANIEPAPGKDDGVLTALEVSALDLSKVETVVLSACETGLGQVAGGEGLLGLQRAFQVAGANTVVASLWKVDDRSTQLLMNDFYDNLWGKKLGKLEALRQAQIKLLRQGATWKDPATSRGLAIIDEQPPLDNNQLPPYYWAAFVLSGDWR